MIYLILNYSHGEDMGRGDKRTRRGKIFKGSYGNTRKQETVTSSKPVASKTGTTKAVAPKKAPATKKGKA